MTSRGSDVIGRCFVDAEKSPVVEAVTRRFYVMTTLDDDVVDVDDCVEHAGDENCSLQTRTIRVDHRDDTGRDRHGAADFAAPVAHNGDNDDGDDDEKERQRKQVLSDQEDDKDEVTDDERQVSGNSDSNDETLRLSDDDQTSPRYSRQSSFRIVRQDGTRAGKETAVENEMNTQNVSRGTELERDSTGKTAEYIDRNRVEPRTTTSHRPVSDDTATGNKISFDRKLVDEIDAAMAQNGYKALSNRAGKSAKSKYSVDGRRLPQGSANSDDMTTTVKDDKSYYPCHVEDTHTQSAGIGNTGKRRQKRLSAIGQHRQKLATSAAGS